MRNETKEDILQSLIDSFNAPKYEVQEIEDFNSAMREYTNRYHIKPFIITDDEPLIPSVRPRSKTELANCVHKAMNATTTVPNHIIGSLGTSPSWQVSFASHFKSVTDQLNEMTEIQRDLYLKGDWS